MSTVSVGCDASGNSSTLRPLSSWYSVMPSTVRILCGGLGGGVAAGGAGSWVVTAGGGVTGSVTGGGAGSGRDGAPQAARPSAARTDTNLPTFVTSIVTPRST